MKTRIKMLKIKIKTLAIEAQLIRDEEKKCTQAERLRRDLHNHRVLDVRQEQRAAFLAYAFLRGREYSQVEKNSKRGPDWARVESLIKKFGTTSYSEMDSQREKFHTWKALANDHIKLNKEPHHGVC